MTHTRAIYSPSRQAVLLANDNGYLELDIASAHAVAVGELPAIHSDPFDRMLVAQARTEGYPLLTFDRRVAEYGAPVVLV